MDAESVIWVFIFFVKAEQLVVEFLIKEMFTCFNFISETYLYISTQRQVQIDILECAVGVMHINTMIILYTYFDFPAVTVKICILEIHHH